MIGLDNQRVVAKAFFIFFLTSCFSLTRGHSSVLNERSGWDLNFFVFEGYNSNVLAESNPTGSFYTELDFELSYSLRTSRTLLQLRGGGGVDLYYSKNLDQNFFPNGGGGIDLFHELTPRTSIAAGVGAEYLSQPSYLSPGSYQYQGEYLVIGGNLDIEHQWRPRFSSITGWDSNTYLYTEPYYQNNLGRVEQIFSNQFLFLWKPTTSLVQEYRLNPRTYLEDSDMNSLGQYFLLGVDRQVNPRSIARGRFGLEQRWLGPGNGGNDHYLGPYGEIGVNYSTGRNNLDLLASYGTQSSGLVGIGESDTFQVSLGLSRQLGKRTKVGISGGYQLNKFEQNNLNSAFSSDVFDAGLVLERKLGRRVSLEAGYRYSGVIYSSGQAGGYSRNVIFLGTKLDL
jgi:hypothetical protein